MGLLNIEIDMDEDDSNLFFKYRPITGNTCKILENQELYFSNSSGFNDPFDCKLDLIWRGTRNTWDGFLHRHGIVNPIERRTKIKQCIENGILKDKKGDFVLDPQKTGYKKAKQNLPLSKDLEYPRINCFSKDKDNILMWSHYADKHKGICLSFKSKKIGNGNFLILDSEKHLLFPVNYQEDLPKQVNMLSNYKHEELAAFLHTKHNLWEYEKEYRLIMWPEDFEDGHIKKFRKEDLEGITFGLRISSSDVERVSEIIKSNYLQEGYRVNFYRASQLRDKYSIEIKKVYNIDNYIEKIKDSE